MSRVTIKPRKLLSPRNLYKMLPFVIYYFLINFKYLDDVDIYYLAFFQFAIIYGIIIAVIHLKIFYRYLDSFYLYAPFSIVSVSMFVDWSLTLLISTIKGPISISTPLIFLFNLAYGMTLFFTVWVLQIGIFSFGYYLPLFLILYSEKVMLKYTRYQRKKKISSPINSG